MVRQYKILFVGLDAPRVEQMALEYTRRYWWLVLIIVPIVVAIIQLVPDFDKDEGKSDDGVIHVQVSGPQFNGDVAFNTVNVVMEQAERTLQEIPKGVVERLQQAMDLLQSRNFEKAIPVLQSAAQTTPVPALFNNLGAAYLATGNLQKATEYVEKARTGSDEEAAAFNLKQIKAIQKSGALHAQGALQEVPFDRKLVASTGVASDRFGTALAVSDDTLVASAPNATVDGKLLAGSAYIFERDPASGRWMERKRLVAQDGVAFDQLGGNVVIDGDTVVLSAFRARVGGVLQQGVAYVFERDAGGVGNWGQVAKLTDDSVGAIGNFGSSLALEGDLLAVGASRGGGNGQVTIFERDRGGPGVWGKVTSILDSAVGDGGTPLEFLRWRGGARRRPLAGRRAHGRRQLLRRGRRCGLHLPPEPGRPRPLGLRRPADGGRGKPVSRRSDAGRGLAG